MVSLIISICNQARQLNQLLSTILKNRHKLETVILDQGSTDNIRQVLTQYSTQFFIRYIKTAANSPLGLLKLGADKARNKHLFFLTAYTDFSEDFFTNALQQMPDPGQGIFFSIEKNVASASQIRLEQKYIKEIFSYTNISNNTALITSHALRTNGACLLCRTDDFRELSGIANKNSLYFDEHSMFNNQDGSRLKK
jgi:hypothetical protein